MELLGVRRRFKVEELLLVMKNNMEKNSEVIPSFLYPQDVYIRTFTASEKILFSVIPCQVHWEFSKVNGESFFNFTLFLWVTKSFQFELFFWRVGFSKTCLAVLLKIPRTEEAEWMQKTLYFFWSTFCIIMSVLLLAKREKGNKPYATLLALCKLQLKLILPLQLVGDKIKSWKAVLIL